MTSNREKKRAVSAGLRKLMNKPGWDPTARRSSNAEEQLQALQADAAQKRAYADAQVCEACRAAQADAGDETALCETHLMEAMGL